MTKLYLLQIDTSHFWTLNWYYIAAVALSATGVLFAIRNFYKKKKVTEDTSSGIMQTQSIHSPINIVNNVNSQVSELIDVLPVIRSEEKTKATVKILFIDDNHTDYKMVSILKKSGWINTKAVKDILDLDNYQILEADIIFVDINGVGTTMFEDQGLGLASALKIKHPNKKIVIYSAETAGDRFHKALRQVDACLPKNAEPYQFIELVQSLSKIS